MQCSTGARWRYFQDVTSVVVMDSGHFVPEEQPEALAKALFTFL